MVLVTDWYAATYWLRSVEKGVDYGDITVPTLYYNPFLQVGPSHSDGT